MSPLLSIDRLEQHFDGPGTVLGPLSLRIERGELLVLAGPSGSGKSTLLRCLAALDRPSGGAIAWEGGRGTVGVVFQEPRLFPWLNVRDNVGFALRGPRADRQARVARLLALVGLADAAERLPKHLSGGMAQRAALARGLATDPSLLLLDEPFSALDPLTRRRLQDHLRTLQQRLGTTMVLVTHDIEEAARLGDRIVVLRGRPAQIVATVRGEPAGPGEAGRTAVREALEATLSRSAADAG